MMRINLEKPLASGEKFEFKISWWYNINNHRINRGRSGYEHFQKMETTIMLLLSFTLDYVFMIM